ncbi:hypothetical protein TRICI_000342 [Trichomonascus ciferrii]|uniref:Uncharacterized protein n=1 Tax=Trichomonascus ciferrii TaxID=44093 RepID=A0A642VDM5_9ASCO|nr:hypothetical protein TRICI_000342 [Trichomonascus ciferrii]
MGNNNDFDNVKVFHLKPLLLVYHFKTSRLYFYGDSSLEELFPSVRFQCFDSRSISANKKYLVSRSDRTTISVWKLDLHNKYHNNSDGSPIVNIGNWKLPDEATQVSAVEWNVEDPKVLVLGTTEGEIVKINVEAPNKVAKVPFTSNMRLRSEITAIASAPCGKGVYAVGYATGELVLFQDASRGFKPIHNLKSPIKYRIRNLSWHPTSKDCSRQSLAVLKGKGNMVSVWSVNLGNKCTLIRHVGLPENHSPTSKNYFLSWGPKGKIVRTSNMGIVTADVRSKPGIVESIDTPNKVLSMALDSAINKCWTYDKMGNLTFYNLNKGKTLTSTIVPFAAAPFEPNDVISIERSPVVHVRAIDIGEVNQIMIKRSPERKKPTTSATSSQFGSDHFSLRGSIHYNADDDNSSISSKSDSSLDSSLSILAPLPRPDNQLSSPMSYYTPPPGSPAEFSGSEFSESPSSSTCSLASEQTSNSLFSDILLKAPWNPNLISNYDPTECTADQFFLKEIFGSTSVHEILSRNIKGKPCKRNLILSLFLRNLKPHEVSIYAKELDSDSSCYNNLSMVLLTIVNLTNGDTTPDILLSLTTAFDRQFVIDELHFITAMLISLGMHNQARALYRDLEYHLEAIIVSMLGDLEWFSLFTEWVEYYSERPASHWQYLKTLHTRIKTGKSVTWYSDSNSTKSVSYNDYVLFANEIATAMF